MNKDLHSKYKNLIDNEKIEFMRRVKQHGGDRL